MSEEDDWFEQALRDLDEESDSSEATTSTGVADDTEPVDGDDDTTGKADRDADPTDNDSDPADAGAKTADNDPSDDGSDPFGGTRDESDESDESLTEDGKSGPDSEREGTTDSADGPSDPDEEDAFGGAAFSQEGSAEGGDDDPFGGGSFGDDDPFGGGSFGGDDPFGGGDDPVEDVDGEAEVSESNTPGGGGSADPFGGYRETSPAPGGGFGLAGPEGDDSTGFDVDPDEFESSIERTDIGIEGLDEMILGGVPRRSLLSVIGGPGTGKTTFGLQFIYTALEAGNNGVYITLEQSRESILSTAEEKGWSFREHAAAGRLAVVAIDPIEMANSLASIRNDLTRLIAEFDADRLVLDSVSLLEMMYDHPSKRRSEVFGFTRSLKEAGVTTLLTSEASEQNPYASRHGLVEYLTDGVLILQYVRGSDFRETRLAVEIQKIRNANHSRETKPYEITEAGISVYGQANIF